MSNELFIHDRFAKSNQTEDQSQDNEPGFRAYSYNPYSVCLQVRAWHKPNPWSKAKPKFTYASAHLNATQIDQLIELLQEERKRVANEPDQHQTQLAIGAALIA